MVFWGREEAERKVGSLLLHISHSKVVFCLLFYILNKRTMWMKNIVCHISKQRILQPSNHNITATLMVSFEGIQDGGSMLPPPLEVSHCRHQQEFTLRKLRMGKHTIVVPDSWGAYQRNDFSEPRVLHLLVHKKSTKCLNISGFL